MKKIAIVSVLLLSGCAIDQSKFNEFRQSCLHDGGKLTYSFSTGSWGDSKSISCEVKK